MIIRPLLCLAVLAAACGGSSTTGSNNTPDAGGSGVVIRGSELSGTLLDGLRTRYPQMQVDTRSAQCPLITFRGVRSVRNLGTPSIYVDNTLMVDTCILTQIISSDVERVEIYPSGATSRPGVQRNANGVIMVFRVTR